MPGVNVTTAARSGPSSPLLNASGQFFVVGQAERGPVGKPYLIRGLADFESVFGKRVPYSFLYDTIKTFFEEGGSQAQIVRVVGPAAATGSVSLVDQKETSPVATLTVSATSPGAWSSSLKVRIENGAQANTFKITVLLNNTVVEVVDNIINPAMAVAKFSASPYIRIANAGSTTPTPDNNPATGEFTITTGSDDRASITNDTYTAALALFTKGLGDGAVAIPDLGTDAHGALVAHAQDHRRIALLSHDVDAEVSELVSAAAAITSDAAGLFAPWVTTPDGAGGTRSIPPEGYVAAVRARAHERVGAWRVPAGDIARANNLAGVAVEYSEEEAAGLDASKVSVIRRVVNSTRLYGWRSLSLDEENFRFLFARDVLNRLVVEGERRLEEFVFAPVDTKGQLLASVQASLVGIVEPMRQAGGLFENVDPSSGEQIDPGYLVETGDTVNTRASIANNEVRARLSVRLSPTASLVSLDIVKVGLLSGF